MKLPNYRSNPTTGEFTMSANVFKIVDDKKHYGVINYYKMTGGWRDMVSDNTGHDFFKKYTNNFYHSGGNSLINQLRKFLPGDFDHFELYNTRGDIIAEYSASDAIREEVTSNDILTPQQALRNTNDRVRKNEHKMREYINN